VYSSLTTDAKKSLVYCIQLCSTDTAEIMWVESANMTIREKNNHSQGYGTRNPEESCSERELPDP
jgi:hypothetical protein